jgi:hypothetical protein
MLTQDRPSQALRASSPKGRAFLGYSFQKQKNTKSSKINHLPPIWVAFFVALMLSCWQSSRASLVYIFYLFD